MQLIRSIAPALLAQGALAATKNFIYIVPDGYGVASQVMARDFFNINSGIGSSDSPISSPIGADELVIGTVRTQSSNSLITDSAASATAFACGVKTYNGAIGVDNDGVPVASVLEAAHLAGLKTGLIATSRITHATPACYSAHVPSRDAENDIAEQQVGFSHPLGSVVDLMMGGGRRHFLSKANGGERADNNDLTDWVKEEGWNYVASKDELNAISENGAVSLPVLGLFASSHMAYEADREATRPSEPTLLEMVEVAIKSLKKATESSDKGFFLMVEASRIDHAAHESDSIGHLYDTLMYNDVMSYVKSQIDEDSETEMLSAADHECGGLTLKDNYSPDLFVQAGKSRSQYVNLGGDAVAGINWSTDYHTAADVALHGYTSGREKLERMKMNMGGNNDNTELARYVETSLGLDLDVATSTLRSSGAKRRALPRDLFAVVRRQAGIDAHNHAHED